MKKFIISAFTSLIVLQCCAQTKPTPGEHKGSTDTFIVSEIPQYGNVKHIVIYNKNNKYNNGIPYSEAEKSGSFLPMNPKKDIHVSNDTIRKIIYGVLNKKLDALHDNKEQISLILKFEPNGKLTDAGFTLNANTVISVQDIEKIDHLLKKRIRATFTGKQYLQYIAINYYPPMILF